MLFRRAVVALLLVLTACGTAPQPVATVRSAEPSGQAWPAAVQPALGPPLRWHLAGLPKLEPKPVGVAYPQPARPRAPVVKATPPSDVWASLARCESGMTNASTGNGFFGYFQFTASTWHSIGEQGLPTDYSYEHQRAAAQRLQARSGWGQWPVCSRRVR